MGSNQSAPVTPQSAPVTPQSIADAKQLNGQDVRTNSLPARFHDWPQALEDRINQLTREEINAKAAVAANPESKAVKNLPKEWWVFLTTGAMFPTTKQHVANLEVAMQWTRDNKKDVAVVCGLISLTNKEYVETKFGSDYMSAGSDVSDIMRAELCELAVRDAKDIYPAHYEQRHNYKGKMCFIDYPQVSQALKDHFVHPRLARDSQDCVQKLKVVYVCGDDHAAKCGLSEGHPNDKHHQYIDYCAIRRRGVANDGFPVGLDDKRCIRLDGGVDCSSTIVRRIVREIRAKPHMMRNDDGTWSKVYHWENLEKFLTEDQIKYIEEKNVSFPRNPDT